jgi:aminopeptidase N
VRERASAPAVGLALAAFWLATPSFADETPLEHELKVGLDPVSHRLTVSDELTLPGGKSVAEFLLNAGLKIVTSVPAAREVPLGDVTPFFGINGGPKPKLRLKRYRVEAPAGTPVVVRYEGVVNYGLSDAKEEYTRGFRETAGILDERGVYLSGGSFWVPAFGPDLFTFRMEVNLPAGWHVISQGNGTSRDAAGLARWDSHGPMDEIYLVGGPLHVFRDSAGVVETQVYLHEKDEALAGKYLAATAQYLEMYRALLGPYPYAKFALVENFWETGYGMPSFTLLGPQVIRFPFILTSSYPHEILHNWWGNSVFVDESSGNWCEGLTAYMADFLIQEQRGKGDEYRRGALQKYRDYVKDGRDFPLSQFRSRESAATEAVGYGKALMGFHMLRRKLGDEVFLKTLVRFYREWRGKRASFRDFQKTAEAVSGGSLASFFDGWITRPGAAALALSVSSVAGTSGDFEIEGTLRQTQPGAPFALDVPLVLQTERGVETHPVPLAGAETRFSIHTASRPLALHADPWFDVFRRLDPRETPSSVGQIFGEPAILAFVASKGSPGEIAGYRKLVEGWKSPSHSIEVKLDSEVKELPADRSIWLLGKDNRFAGPLLSRKDEVSLSMPLAGHSAVLVDRHPANVEKAVGWIFADPPGALPGLGRKLPHYGKYSYLGFEGDEPVNVLKGQWQDSDSPLRLDLRETAARQLPIPPLPAEPRKALAELPPVFSQKALTEHVTFLAAPELLGRGLGSEGLLTATLYVARRFDALGLTATGEAGSFLQTFTAPAGPAGKPVEAANIVGVLPGMKPEWNGQSVLVTAHLDHLGLGWPDVRKGNEGKVHPGADDNASGVAVLLELARVFASGEKPKRTIVFVVFTGEEAGRLGSKHYASHPGAFPLEKVMGVVNIDTVGRLFDQKLSVLGTGTASEWQHIFRGASFVTGVESRNVPESAEASDQLSFIEKGVPAVQIFSGAHADYHRPSDTADRVDGAGLVKVATFVKEGIAYLAERPEPLTNTIPRPAGGAPPPAAQPPGAGAPARRVSFGTVPDFEFPGPGVKVTGVVPGSPAEKAGVKEGDILMAIDGQPVTNLRGYSDILKTLSPGQTVKAAFKRGGQDVTLPVTLAER